MPTWNFVDDFDGVGDDATSNDTAFTAFRTAARLEVDTVALSIPTGIFRTSLTIPFDGISSLIVTGAGSANSIIKNTGSAFRLGCLSGFVQRDGFHAALANSVYPGDISVTCTTAAQASRFPVGRWVSLAALEWQGDSGYPPNHHNIEYLEVASNNTDTGVVTFTTPVQGTYLIDYPLTWDGTFVGSYPTGGPAYLFCLAAPTSGGGLDTAWNTESEFHAFNVTNTVGQPGDQVYMNGRSILLSDMTFTDCAPICSINKYARFHNITAPTIQVEADKQVELFEITGNSDIRRVQFQSSSIQLVRIKDTVHIEDLNGTPKNIEIIGSGVVIDTMSIGPIGYGNTDSVYAGPGAGETDGPTISGISAVTANRLDAATFTHEHGGSLTYQSSFGTGGLTWGAEGAQLFLAGQTSVDGSNHVHYGHPTWVRRITSEAGKAKLHCWMPSTAPSPLTGTVYVTQHPCRNVTFLNATGCAEALDLSRAPSGLPLYSHCKRIDQNFLVAQTLLAWGYVKYIKVNVTRAYTGAQSTAILHLGGQFEIVRVINADGSYTASLNFDIDTKFAGERVFAASGVTGAQGDDDMPAASVKWLIFGFAPKLIADMSGDTDEQKPLITIEVLTDQFQKVGMLL